MESALSAVTFERVIKVEEWLSIESALSAVPFKGVHQVCGFGRGSVNIESALSALDLKA